MNSSGSVIVIEVWPGGRMKLSTTRPSRVDWRHGRADHRGRRHRLHRLPAGGAARSPRRIGAYRVTAHARRSRSGNAHRTRRRQHRGPRATVERAVDGTSAVVNLVGTTAAKNAEQFYALHRDAPRRLAEAAPTPTSFARHWCTGSAAPAPAPRGFPFRARQIQLRHRFTQAETTSPSCGDLYAPSMG